MEKRGLRPYLKKLSKYMRNAFEVNLPEDQIHQAYGSVSRRYAKTEVSCIQTGLIGWKMY